MSIALALFLCAVPQQVHWQRSLEDALAIAQAQRRPILVAVNMDGESASERIVRERYRDPAFVAHTRAFVCLVSSVFRHTPRDHDDEGRRIPCPRLGEITCGEHIALEPALYDKWLGGERIAPRHALILPDGTKSFDLFLLFDLRELDRALEAAVHGVPAPAAERGPEGDDLAALAAARSHRGRLAFEERLTGELTEGRLLEALDAIRAQGDAGSIEALRLLLARAVGGSEESRCLWMQTAQELEIAAPAAALARERIQGLGNSPGTVGLDVDARLLPVLAELDRDSAATRSLVLGYLALGDEDDRLQARRGLGSILSSAEIARVERAIAAEGGVLDLRGELERSAAVSEVVAESVPKTLRPAETLEREMEEVDRALRDRASDPDLHARFGRVALELARVQMETGGRGAQLLLEDAERWLARAGEARPDDVELLLDRARAAFLLARFEAQERLAIAGLAALERAPGADAPGVPGAPGAPDAPDATGAVVARATEVARVDEQRIEAQRWIGDAAGRLLSTRSGGDLADEAAGMLRAARSLGAVAASTRATETDWQSLISIYGAIGMRREELACAQAAALRLPESSALRQVLNGALWLGGRIELAPVKAEWVAARHPDNAACDWFAGYAHLLAAEERRRGEDPDGAIEHYRSAESAFERSIAKNPEYAESADHYRAIAALGRGFAHLLADRRGEAAECLVQAIAIRPAIVSARDGLDREAVDLLDSALEWRESGPSTVAPLELLDALEKAEPENASWARVISDSELREALRADGRGKETQKRERVRDGRTISVDVPVPTAEGDEYMRASVLAARRALAHGAAPENRRALAQAATVFAERLLERGDVAEAQKLLAEAAPLLEKEAPPESASLEELRELAAGLRRELGEARPVFRPGR